MANDGLPELGTLLTNHENRLNQVEYELGILQGRMPKSKVRQGFWWLYSIFWVAVPIIGGLATLIGEDPWKESIAFGAFGILIGKTVSGFVMTAAQGPRPHRSLLIDDYR